MLVIEAIFLGVIQGLTEFLPVSSSGHLVIAQHFLRGIANYPLSLDVSLHMGTLFALLVYFRKDLFNMIVHPRELIPIAVATIVTALLALPARHFIETAFASASLATLMLIVTGCILYVASRTKGNVKTTVGSIDAMKIGVAQAVALLPGISRSGITISFGILFGMDSGVSTRFSFLIAIPAIFGAGILEAKDISAIPGSLVLPYILGFLVSFLVGLWSLRWLMRLLKTDQRSLRYFAYYCWTVGVLSLLVMLFVE